MSEPIKRDQIIIDVFGVLRIGEIINRDMLNRLQYADRKGYKITVMFSTTVVDLHKREELHACTGWLTDNRVPWHGIWLRDTFDNLRGISYTELKVGWVNSIPRETIRMLYDFDPKCDPTWKAQGFVKGQDWLIDMQGSKTRCDVWVPAEAIDECMVTP